MPKAHAGAWAARMQAAQHAWAQRGMDGGPS